MFGSEGAQLWVAEQRVEAIARGRVFGKQVAWLRGLAKAQQQRKGGRHADKRRDAQGGGAIKDVVAIGRGCNGTVVVGLIQEIEDLNVGR